MTGSTGRLRRVVIAGGGPAALEAVLALQELARDRVAITLVAPDPEFAYRPLAVGEPFGAAEPLRFSIAALALDRGLTLVRDTVAAVDPDEHSLTTGSGATIPYEALVLAIGAQSVEAVPGAVTFRGPEDVLLVRHLLHGLLDRPAPQAAFVVAPAAAWTLPIYELALFSRAWAGARGAMLASWVVTHERRPLEVFGARTSAEIAKLLDDAGVRVWTGAEAELVEDGRLWLAMEGGLPVDLAVALPAPVGRALPGLPHDERGFTPVDAYGRVPGAADVYAIGDMTTRPLKQGGLAAGQADATASAIASWGGADVEALPYRPELRAVLVTPQGPLHLQRLPSGEAWPSRYTEAATTWPADKIAARHLGAYLAARPGLQLDGVAAAPSANAAANPQS